jgi:very-short-patch-repair endonuclease
MEQIADLMLMIRNDTDYVFKQMIVWNKRFDGARNKGFLDGFIVPDGLRNYQKMVEYILFYTFQDETGLARVFGNKDCFITIKAYLDLELEKSGFTQQTIKKVLENEMASHYFGFFIKDKNIVIEFDGDYWHGKMGNIERENNRDNKLLNEGYKVLHIKEIDWKENPKGIINMCKEFIYG